jgi:hypothetical protein
VQECAVFLAFGPKMPVHDCAQHFRAVSKFKYSPPRCIPDSAQTFEFQR